MELKFKRLDDSAVLPIRANKGDAGLDLTAINVTTEVNECGEVLIVYHTGIAVEIPEGYVGLLFPRSSISKKALMASNCVGVIDSGYRGEIMSKMRTTTNVVPAIYKPGERFCQLVIVPYLSDITIVESNDLSDSDRGEGGYGSSDTKNINAESESIEDAVEVTSEN